VMTTILVDADELDMLRCGVMEAEGDEAGREDNSIVTLHWRIECGELCRSTSL
jgi:hypothetical protein